MSHLDNHQPRYPRATLNLSWRGMLPWLIAFVLGFGCATAATAVLEPAIGNVFSRMIVAPEGCSFSTTVVVFEDNNRNRVRDFEEPGVANVDVGLALDDKPDEVVAVTDAQGLAQVFWRDSTCKSASRINVVIHKPPSFSATTPTMLGPFRVTYLVPAPALYVGFRRNQ